MRAGLRRGRCLHTRVGAAEGQWIRFLEQVSAVRAPWGTHGDCGPWGEGARALQGCAPPSGLALWRSSMSAPKRGPCSGGARGAFFPGAASSGVRFGAQIGLRAAPPDGAAPPAVSAMSLAMRFALSVGGALRLCVCGGGCDCMADPPLLPGAPSSPRPLRIDLATRGQHRFRPAPRKGHNGATAATGGAGPYPSSGWAAGLATRWSPGAVVAPPWPRLRCAVSGRHHRSRAPGVCPSAYRAGVRTGGGFRPS